MVSLKAEKVEGKLQEKVEEILRNPKNILGQIRRMRQEIDRNVAIFMEKIANLESDIVKLENQRQKVVDDLIPSTSGDFRQILLKRGEDLSNQVRRLERLKMEYEDRLKESEEFPAYIGFDVKALKGRRTDIENILPPRSVEYNPDTGEMVCHYPVEFLVKSQDR
jgi:archaellum component FlaC